MSDDESRMRGLAQRAVSYGRMIKFSHSVFALPFALSSAAIAASGHVPWPALPWIVLAMIGARSAAMGFNRLADQAIDARNPRTAGRELPRGVLKRSEVWAFVVLSGAALVFAAAMLNPVCLALSPVALLVVFGYSYTKRFTALSHLVLGLSLGIAPIGAWLAVRGTFDVVPLVIALAVMAWVAGFDTVYACQDVDFDRQAGLHSLPARLGVAGALRVARVLHVLAVLLLASVYVLAPLHPAYLGGVAAVALLLVYEHSLVRADDLSRIDAAFFTVNGWISAGYFAFTAVAARLA
jgi:4-hydroxybenzoate polyprenyltransferase